MFFGGRMLWLKKLGLHPGENRKVPAVPTLSV